MLWYIITGSRTGGSGSLSADVKKLRPTKKKTAQSANMTASAASSHRKRDTL
jgi:hypothetical protein